MNQVNLIGRLTKAPELRYTQDNKAVATFTLAVNRGYGENKQADFINIVVWEKQAENVSKYLEKGSLIGLTGRVQTRSYDATDGTKRYVTEIVANNVEFLESKKELQPSDTPPHHYEVPEEITDPFEKFGQQLEISDDDLPF
jgi:single-strand DNA-binding protein